MDVLFPLLTILAPLLSALLIRTFQADLGERCARIGIAALACSAVGAIATLWLVVYGEPIVLTLLTLGAGAFDLTLLVDRLAGIMMVLISLVSLVIHLYSNRYMVGDAGYTRFFARLGLLTFVLLSLVTSGNLLWLFACWHLVTWLLGTLLAFNQDSLPAQRACRSTVTIHSIGDAAFLLAMGLLYHVYGTLDLRTLFDRLAEGASQPVGFMGLEVPTFATLLLLVSVMTKSAQFPFHIWLPGTIEAPTPVSALLHAGIVNAGGFLVNRLAPLYGLAPTTLHLMFLIGALTALIGATTMLTQSSIKRTLVYSTMGQMGYMVMECGLGAFALAVFHLCAHGLFKATLFLNSGANIHASRTDLKLPDHRTVGAPAQFSFITWATGLVMTLMLPLMILLMAHGLVNIPLFEAQGTVIFLFFAWVTSAQAIFSLYRLHSVASWKVSATMLATLAFIGLTYLWAGETFTHFLYPAPGQAAAYFQVAGWNQGLFDAFMALSACMVIGVWMILYGKAHGVRILVPEWLRTLQAAAYVAFLNGLYVEDGLRALRGGQHRKTS
ncbi:MAG: putative NADH-quinone oxidoreductase subunit L [Nitrospira sp. OLB3]|nr:MAG: putative NADH-quinone oxidoreductase subunit L [Nitrospira sp. OLB3]RIK61181.1 MAG: NADH-quinone oxidoreductase subunit L [Nitrospira sp.]